MKIIVATNNPGKIKEYNSILRSFGYEAISLNDAGIESDPEETGNSYSENALIKAKAASEKTDLDVIADDSGIEIEALSQNGKAFPGILSGRWGVKIGGGDWHKTRLTVLDMLKGKKNRKAKYVCCICLIEKGSEPKFFFGECEGRILDSEEGDNGFAYDPIFRSDERSLSFGICPKEIKNEVSHRGKAIRELSIFLQKGGK
jgi:XTP/dITP diphosphohydrolase